MRRGAGSRGCARDLESGAWERRHADLLELEELDRGYRLLVARLNLHNSDRLLLLSGLR